MERDEKLYVTSQEMICLNSLDGGGRIPGIQLNKPLFIKEEKYIADTIAMMERDGLADENHELTTTGRIFLRALQMYKRSMVRMEIDGVCIGFHRDRSCVYITKEERHYRMFFHDRAIIFQQLLEKYPFLRRGQDRQEVIHHIQYHRDAMEPVNHMKTRYPGEDMRLEIRKYREDTMTAHLFLCDDGREIQSYNILEKKEQTIGARDARMLLWKLFELEEEE